MVDRQQCDLFAQSVSLSADKSSEKSADVSHCVHGMLYAAYIRIQTWQERNGFPSFPCSLCLGGDDSPRLPPSPQYSHRKEIFTLLTETANYTWSEDVSSNFFSIDPIVEISQASPRESPRQKLWWAVLIDVFFVRDAAYQGSKGVQPQYERDQAWVIDESEEPLSFRWTCRQLALDPQRVKQAYHRIPIKTWGKRKRRTRL